MNSNVKKILGIIVLVAAVLAITYAIKPRPADNEGVTAPSERPMSDEVIVQDNYVRYPGRDGATAFALLQEAAEVDYDQFSFGVFVKSIGGVTPDDEHFWKLYLNGAGAQVGADQLETSDGDLIEWKLEEIDGNY